MTNYVRDGLALQQAQEMAEEVEGCREQLKEAEAKHRALSFQQSALSDQAAFDAGRCKRLEAEVTSLSVSKHLSAIIVDQCQCRWRGSRYCRANAEAD